jgi:translation initiation factor 1A
MGFHKFNKGNQQNPEQQEFNTRLKLPRGREVIGIIAQRVGGIRMLVSCMDGKTRNCRVPGRLKRDLWLREGDVVIVEPWEFEGDEKGDILYKYSKTDIVKLQNQGLLKTGNSEF